MEKKNNKRSKKGHYQKILQLQRRFQHVMRGFLVTAPTNREKSAVPEAINILLQYLEQVYPGIEEMKQKAKDEDEAKREKQKALENLEPKVEKKAKSEGEDKSQNIENELENELKQLRKPSEQFFFSVKTGCKGVIFLKINDLYKNLVCPIKIVDSIMDDVHIKRLKVGRYCERIIPITKATRTNFTDLQNVLDEIIEKEFQGKEEIKWMLYMKRRNNDKIRRQEVQDYLLEKMPSNHSVFYKHPEVTINVEINQHLMCTSVLRKFIERRRYSVKFKLEANQIKKHVKPEENKVEETLIIPKEPVEEKKELQKKKEDEDQEKDKGISLF